MYSGPYTFKPTENFRLCEFIVSCGWPDLAKKIRLDKLDGAKAQYMASTILQPIRNYFNKPNPMLDEKEHPLIITSGKCSLELNQAIIGRSETSDHLWEGPSCAVDFLLRGVALQAVYYWIRENLPFAYGQLILYPDRHIHVSLPTHAHQQEAWIKNNA